jgi:hypothetical protein
MRKRMTDLELPAYMRALAAARQLYAQESSDRLNEHVEHLLWLDKLAGALGIATDAEDWWDVVTEAKREKILGRISVLRGLRPTPETVPVPVDSLQAAPDDPQEVYATCLSCGDRNVMRGFARTCCEEGASTDKALGLTSLNR